MLLQNIHAVRSDRVTPCDMRLEHGRIAAFGRDLAPYEGEEVIDGGGAYAFAGLIDTHTHGAMGSVYYNLNSDVDTVLAFEAREGVTMAAATLESAPIDKEIELTRHLLPFFEKKSGRAKLGGIHFEGPFLNPAKKGAMNPDGMVMPNVPDFDRLYEAAEGHMKLITVAPDMPGALDVISRAVSRGVKVSAGHTMASAEQMKAAVDVGLTRMTHTFNACRSFDHREPGILGTALTDDRVTCEVICDFAHLHPLTVELIYRAKGAARFTAISDSEFAAGLAEGKLISEDGRERIIDGGVARLADGTICGSASSLARGFRNLCSLDIPLWEVSRMCSENPAKALGVFDQTGSLDVGKCADLFLADKDFGVKAVFVDGEKI